MTHSKSFLCASLGSSSIKAAEFFTDENGRLALKDFAIRAGQMRKDQETATLLRRVVAELGEAKSRANLCAPAHQVFTKFVNLPPVDTLKLQQIIQFEARQQVPYPLEQAVWDFQILREGGNAEAEVLLAAAKADAVEEIFRAAERAGLRLQTLDAPIAALANAFLYNYSDVTECALLLDIGAKTTHLLIFEEGRVFARAINLGAGAITSEFVAEAKIPFAKAEQIKIERGFVGLGGAYEEPESAQEAMVSKIARQVMTRLHAQVAQTIQFYRSQRGGSAPRRVFLAGGGSLLAYTPQFFAEKLGISASYFDAFRNVAVAPRLEGDDLNKVTPALGELVGLALREVARCPVEVNLLPKTARKQQALAQRRPYMAAAFLTLIAGLFAHGYFYGEVASIKRDVLSDIRSRIIPLQARADQLSKREKEIANAKAEIDVYTGYLKNRYFWAEGLVEMRDLLMNVEETLAKPGQPVGVWIETFGTVPQEEVELEESFSTPAPSPIIGMPPEMIERYFPELWKLMVKNGLTRQSLMRPGAPAQANTNLLSINVKFRAVNLATPEDPAANSRLVFLVEEKFQKSPIFDAAGSKLTGELDGSEMLDPKFGTFGFGMTLKLKNDLRM